MAHLEDGSGDSPRTNTGLIARSRVGGNGLANAGRQEWGKPGRAGWGEGIHREGWGRERVRESRENRAVG